MRLSGALAGILISLAGAALLASGAQAQQKAYVEPPTPVQNIPVVDPMDPQSCRIEKGWMWVHVNFVHYLTRSTKVGNLSEAKGTELAGWNLAQRAQLIEDNDLEGYCLRMIAKRLEEGF